MKEQEAQHTQRPIKRAILNTAMVGILGAGAVSCDLTKDESTGEIPLPTGPRVTGIEPTGPYGITGPEATGPFVESTKPPPFERTGEFAAELGSTSPRIFTLDGGEVVHTYGILANFDRSKVDFSDSGEKASMWVFKFYFGQDAKGNPIYMNFSWGPDDYNAWVLTLPGAKTPITAGLGSSSWERSLMDAGVLKGVLESKIGHEFGLQLTVKGPDKNYQVYKNSSKLVEALEKRNSGSEERIKIDRDNIGFLSGIYFPPRK